MKMQEGNLLFDFQGALDAFKFDEQNKVLPSYHGLSHCMKAVDFVVEYKKYYLFVEVKNPLEKIRYESNQEKNDLVKNLALKFRDTFIYRWAERKIDKPIRFQCLVEVDNALTLNIMDQLKSQLPLSNLPKRWSRSLVELCAVSNMDTWNKVYDSIPVTKI